MKILGVDAGNNEIKIFGERGAYRIVSVLGEYRERKLQNVLTDSDIFYEYNGRKGFAGSLAESESEFSGSMVGTTKAHEDTLIRVLIGICKYDPEGGEYQIVVGQPISRHTDDEKQRIRGMLQGAHRIALNGRESVVELSRVEVSAEGGVAFWSSPRRGLTRILDFGSGTVNGATLRDGRYVDKDSFTLPYGLSTIQSDDKDAFARSVFIESQKKHWRKSDIVLLIGGGAESMLSHISKFFPDAEVMRPKVGETKILHPVYANAVGMYAIAKEIFR